MNFKTIMMAAGAAVSLLAFEPTTILLKVAIGAAGAVCMKVGIYSDERCPVCGNRFHDAGRGLICPIHNKFRATSFKVIFGKVTKRFSSYEDADRFLTGVRFKTDEKTFDERDYRKDNPLGFANISQKWLGYKGKEVRPGTLKNIKLHIRIASEYFGEENVKEIRYGHLEDFIHGLEGKSDKTRHNILSTIHSFFIWLCKRQEIADMPSFPAVKYELGTRRTVDKDIQLQIIVKVREICPDRKVYLGIKWLATYISIRPGELIKLKEGEIDLVNGYLYFPHPKEKKFKAVPILPEDVEEIKSYNLTFPALPFFRHEQSKSGIAANAPYGEKYFYKGLRCTVSS